LNAPLLTSKSVFSSSHKIFPRFRNSGNVEVLPSGINPRNLSNGAIAVERFERAAVAVMGVFVLRVRRGDVRRSWSCFVVVISEERR
jgi:hypothetical protein